MDSVHFIEGVAPEGRDCRIEVLRSATRERVRSKAVEGAFSVDVTAGGFTVAPVDVLAWCDGQVVKTLEGIRLRRRHGPVSLGRLE